MVDFAGSDNQTKGGINMTPSFRDSYTNLAIRCYLDPNIPNNEGCFAPITITAPEGTIVNPRRGAAVAGRSPMISRVVDVVMGCMAKALPHRAIAGYGGCNAQPVISGRNDKDAFFIFLDSNWGGLGGRANKDGSTCLSFPQNVGNHPIEVLESRYPVQIERYEIRTDSEGPGKYRGGFGSIKDYRLLADVDLQVPGDRVKLPPFGLFGGQSAVTTVYAHLTGAGEVSLRTKRAYELNRGDLLSVRTSGGGGLGNPLEREPEAVASDIGQGYITVERGERDYGVVLQSTGEVDMRKTSELRDSLRHNDAGELERALSSCVETVPSDAIPTMARRRQSSVNQAVGTGNKKRALGRARCMSLRVRQAIEQVVEEQRRAEQPLGRSA
jgi:N-methylhydantoinase B